MNKHSTKVCLNVYCFLRLWNWVCMCRWLHRCSYDNLYNVLYFVSIYWLLINIHVRINKPCISCEVNNFPACRKVLQIWWSNWSVCLSIWVQSYVFYVELIMVMMMVMMIRVHSFSYPYSEFFVVYAPSHSEYLRNVATLTLYNIKKCLLYSLRLHQLRWYLSSVLFLLSTESHNFTCKPRRYLQL